MDTFMNYSPRQKRKLKFDAIPSKNIPDVIMKISPVEHRKKCKVQNDEDLNLSWDSKSTSTMTTMNCTSTNHDNTPKQFYAVENVINNRKPISRCLFNDMDESISSINGLDSSLNRCVKIHSMLLPFFTKTQINYFINPKNKIIKWELEDITKAIILKIISTKAYNYLRDTLHYALPGLSTLRKWSSNFSIENGVLDGVMAIMEKKVNFTIQSTSMDEKDKITALSIDKVYIAHDICFDKVNEKVIGPHKTVQVIMARVTSDMGTGDVGLWKSMAISHDNPSFSHSITGRAVHVFEDVPHLIKLLRNHFIDHGFLLDKSKLSKSVIESLMTLSRSGDLKLTFKLTDLYLHAKGYQRQKCAEIILLVNNWFDLLNSQQPYGDNSNAYGLEIDEQNKLLDEMDNFIKTMLVHSKKSFMPFQKGILLTYVITRRLNQDILENFFSFMKGIGGFDTYPNPLDFKYRLRSYILGKHSAVVLTSNQNTEENKEAECLLNACDMTEESNKFLDKESVFVGNVYNEAEIYFTHDNKIETKLALRGTSDAGPLTLDEPIHNDGTFRALMRMRMNFGDKMMTDRIENGAIKAMYISPTIQNNLITIIGKIIIKILIQMSFCVRYVDEDPEHQFILREGFLKFVSVENTTSKNIANVILETIKCLGIDSKYMVGQGYDGAASMSGNFNGVQAIIRKLKRDIETSSKALQLGKTIITSDFVISVVTASILFTQTLPLCKNLQFVNCDLTEAIR
ncbi:hypothetical protein QTP88_019837 [Uroleucon formosanum]